MDNIVGKKDDIITEENQLNVSLDTSDVCSESWVELWSVPSSSPERVTPLPHMASAISEEYMRLLREAQRESNNSSAKGSLAGSRGSPKSPPNSPNQEKTAMGEEHWNQYFINNEKDPVDYYYERNLEWIWDWSSRPDQHPPKAWHFNYPKNKNLSFRYARVGDTGLFSKKGLCTLFITNIISLLLGTGFGLWLSKRGGIYMPSVHIQ